MDACAAGDIRARMRTVTCLGEVSMRLLRSGGAFVAACALLLLTACSGATADVTFTFAEDGSFTQVVSVEGVSLDEAECDNLEDAGWMAVSSAAGFTASRAFDSVKEYGDANTALDGVLLEG